MKWVIVTGFLVTLVRFGGGKVPPTTIPESQPTDSETPQVECLAGSEWESNCHFCHCTESGIAQCLKQDTCLERIALSIADPIHCRPNTTFRHDCNTCVCLDSGRPLCTRKLCLKTSSVDSKKESSSEEDEGEELGPPNLTTLSRRVRATSSEKLKVCTPREEFRLDCNTCLCDDEGQSFSCTRIDCYKNGGSRKKRGVSDLQRLTLKCAAGSVFERDCNTCRCADDGEHAMCTNKNCQTTTKRPEPEKGSSDSGVHNTDSDPGFRCNPGEQFKRDCKDCTCSADGKSYFCTLRLCDEFIVPGI